MRYIIFTPEDSTSYEVMYDGIHATRRSFSGQETRIVAKVLEKVEAFGSQFVRGKDQEGRAIYSYKMNPDGSMLVLEDAEYNLLREAIDQTPWSAAGARKVPALMDLLDKAPTKDPTAEQPSTPKLVQGDKA